MARKYTNISVTGAPTSGGLSPAQAGPVPVRMNINDLYQTGGPAWDLYIQALAELQAVNENDALSYFQIMGIHGLPFLPWNGVGQVVGGADMAGFCPHNMLLFGLWHRPYVALYEQVLVSHALNISLRYSDYDAPAYRTAAEALRVAYWDWARTPILPDAVTVETVSVNSPTGPITMPNPFHRYHFQKFPFTFPLMSSGKLSAQNHTTRCPTKDLADNVTAVNEGLATSGNLKSQVYDVFTTVQSFQEMETTSYNKLSFESPHNNVHDSVGCGDGTMYDLNWSAFDPIFMLHHANVDRLIALWQAIYYHSSIFDTSGYEGALYGTAAGNVSADTPLKPFHAADGTFHTSRSVRNVSALGYSYPELNPTAPDGQSGVYTTREQLSAYVKFKVNALYSDISDTAGYYGPRSRPRRAPAAPRTTEAGRRDGMALSKTWSVALEVEKAQVDLPATINCYLGEEMVGKMALLASPAAGVTHSTIPLDRVLTDAGFDLVDEDAVTGYLAEGLRFEVQKIGGTTLNAKTISSLQIAVVERDVTPRKSDHDFPTYGAAKNYPWTTEE